MRQPAHPERLLKHRRAFVTMRKGLAARGLVVDDAGFRLTPAGQAHVVGLCRHLRGEAVDCRRFGPRTTPEAEPAPDTGR